MKKLDLAAFTRNLKASTVKHSPEILTGIGIAGMIGTTILAVGATPKAVRLIDAKKEDLVVDKLSAADVVKTCWKCYIPAAVTGAASVACIIGANSINAKRNAALTAAYTLSTTALKEYREKTLETVGEKKEKTIRDKVSEEQIKKSPVSTDQIIVTEHGRTLCYDPMSDRYFYSDINKIKKAQNDLNEQILKDAFNQGVSLNDFYDELRLKHTSLGDDLGWNLDIGTIDIYFSAQVAGEETQYDGQPCIVLNYTTPPQYNF